VTLVLRISLAVCAILAILLGAAGRWDVWFFWAWTGVIWTTATFTYTWLGHRDPEFLRERLAPPSDRDRATRRLVALPFLALLVIAGLDVRLGWSPVPLGATIAGLGLVALGFALVAWVLLTNRFASSAVRIQEERGHRVITNGPYRIVRHPMYLAVVLVCIGSGPALGSWLATLPLLPVAAIFVRRTRIEDRMLLRELAGYDTYASNVRWRVIPLVF
jgi:protein-S-isoprenylcysteine O-methyltransferase Ste14